MNYKWYLFEAPEDWDLKECSISIKGDIVEIHHTVNRRIYEVLTAELLDGDNYKIEEDMSNWESDACAAMGR